MQSEVDISADEVNVYVTSKIKASPVGLVVITGINLVLIGLFVFFGTQVNEKNSGSWVLPLLIMTFALIRFPIRYWFWNMYGEECLVINPKTISYYYDYAIFKTSTTTIFHRKVNFLFENIREEDRDEYGAVTCISYNEKTDQPEEIYRFAVQIKRSDYEKICKALTILDFQAHHDREDAGRIFLN